MASVGGVDGGVELVCPGEAGLEVVVAQARVQAAALGERRIRDRAGCRG